MRCYSTKPMHDEIHKQGEESNDESFADILKEFESARRTAPAAKGKEKGKEKGKGKKRPPMPALRGTVVGVSGDFVLVDYGGKSEGTLPKANLLDAEGNLSVQRGDTFEVAITGFDSEGMAKLSRVTG